jgi:hypothetical protein
VATLVHYTGLSERTVRTCLDLLEAEGIVSPCDPDIIAARIKRADRRPTRWDLDLSLVHGDPDQPGVTVPDGQSPTGRAGLAEARRPIMKAVPAGPQSPHAASEPIGQFCLSSASRPTIVPAGNIETKPAGGDNFAVALAEPAHNDGRGRSSPVGGAVSRGDRAVGAWLTMAWASSMTRRWLSGSAAAFGRWCLCFST